MDSEILDRLFGELAENRRHFDVVAEGLRGEVRQVAEGVAAVSSRLNRVEAKLESKIAEEATETRAMIRLSYTELDRRLRTLETSMESLGARVDRLEAAG